MNATALLQELTSRGVQLSRDGDRLRVRAPRGTITEGDREALQRCKPALLELLAISRMQATKRPVLHFRTSAGWATVLGRPGESIDQLRADLIQRLGAEVIEFSEP
jgi:hypothetical protein